MGWDGMGQKPREQCYLVGYILNMDRRNGKGMNIYLYL